MNLVDYHYISLQDAEKFVALHGATILDIRTLLEYCTGHLCSATLVDTPIPPLNSNQRQTLKRKLIHVLQDMHDRHPIIVYSKKRLRSELAYEILLEIGFVNVFNLGGIEEQPLLDLMLGNTQLNLLHICICKS